MIATGLLLDGWLVLWIGVVLSIYAFGWYQGREQGVVDGRDETIRSFERLHEEWSEPSGRQPFDQESS